MKTEIGLSGEVVLKGGPGSGPHPGGSLKNGDKVTVHGGEAHGMTGKVIQTNTFKGSALPVHHLVRLDQSHFNLKDQSRRTLAFPASGLRKA